MPKHGWHQTNQGRTEVKKFAEQQYASAFRSGAEFERKCNIYLLQKKANSMKNTEPQQAEVLLYAVKLIRGRK